MSIGLPLSFHEEKKTIAKPHVLTFYKTTSCLEISIKKKKHEAQHSSKGD